MPSYDSVYIFCLIFFVYIWMLFLFATSSVAANSGFPIESVQLRPMVAAFPGDDLNNAAVLKMIFWQSFYIRTKTEDKAEAGQSRPFQTGSKAFSEKTLPQPYSRSRLS